MACTSGEGRELTRIEVGAIPPVAHDVRRIAVVRRAEDVSELMREDQRHARLTHDDVGSRPVARRRNVRATKSPGRLEAFPRRSAPSRYRRPSVDDGVDDEHVDRAAAQPALEAMARTVVFEDEFVVGQPVKLDSRKAHTRAGEVGARAFNPCVYPRFFDAFADVNGEGQSSRDVCVGAPVRNVRTDESKDEYGGGLHACFDGLELRRF